MPGYQLHTTIPWDTTVYDLDTCFDKWGVRDSDIRGRPRRSWTYAPITVEFTHPSGQRIVVTKSDQDTAEANLRAIYLALEDMRMIERRGLADLIGTVFLQLGAPHTETCWDVLGLGENAHSREHVERAFRLRAMEVHPDHGGTNEQMQKLNRAREEALRELEG